MLLHHIQGSGRGWLIPTHFMQLLGSVDVVPMVFTVEGFHVDSAIYLKCQNNFVFADEGVQGIHRREFAHLGRIIFAALQAGSATQNGGATV